MKKIANERKLKKQADDLAVALRKVGYDEETVQRRVQRALDRARSIRTAKREPAVNRFAGCASVTAVAEKLGMARATLFAWLERAGWLLCGADGWEAKGGAVEAGWVVMRGPHSMRWPQITLAGAQEIASRLAAEYEHSDD